MVLLLLARFTLVSRSSYSSANYVLHDTSISCASDSESAYCGDRAADNGKTNGKPEFSTSVREPLAVRTFRYTYRKASDNRTV